MPDLEMKNRYEEEGTGRPNPLYQTGVVDTTGTGGSDLDDVSPAFQMAEERSAALAKRALDDDDSAVPRATVVLPGDRERDKDEAKQAVEKRAERSQGKVFANAPGPSEQRAAQEFERTSTTAGGNVNPIDQTGGVNSTSDDDDSKSKSSSRKSSSGGSKS